MKNKYILLLLFLIVILFSLLGSFGEGFEDMPVPSCDTKDCKSDDDYILKSQIVPPVCPACPPFIGKEGESTDEKISTSETTIEEEKEKEKSNKESNYNFKQTIEEKQLPANQNERQNGSQGQNPLKELGSSVGGMFDSKLNQNDISEYKNEIEKLKDQLKELKSTNGACPPCPACERCPEPSFDCKKVPNYRSTSVGNYLPIPILNDFSSFS